MKNKRLLKKYAACAAALAMTLTSSAFAVSAADTVAGDVNNDGIVSSSDLSAMKKYLLNIPDSPEILTENADMNSDGSVNIVDFILLKRYIIEGGIKTEENAIHFGGTSVTGNGVLIDGTTVTINSSGTYVIDGEMTTDAQIIVNVPAEDIESVDLILNEVFMKNDTDTPCIMVENAEKTKITFNGTSVLRNTFEDALASSAVIYAKDDLTFTKNSTGTLDIASNSCMGIYCNNDIKFNSGDINVTTDFDGTKTASADAVKAKGRIENTGADLSVDTSGDGIKSTKENIFISGGITSVKSGKDAIQAETAIAVSGGNVAASGDRGITSVGTLNITGGTVFATATDNQISFTVNESTQYAATLDFAAEHKKAEVIKLGDNTYTANKKYSFAFISDASLANGESYEVYIDDAKCVSAESADGNFKITDAITAFTGVAVK